MKLDANGVRVAYPCLGMEIAFAEMSEENGALARTAEQNLPTHGDLGPENRFLVSLRLTLACTSDWLYL
jgi:hypothetical protein